MKINVNESMTGLKMINQSKKAIHSTQTIILPQIPF